MLAKRFALGFFFLTFAIAAWAYFYPRPYRLCMEILIAIPWLAIALIAVSMGRLRMVGKDRAKLAMSLIAPCIIVGYRAFHDLEPTKWGLATLFAFGAAAVFLGLTELVDRGARNPIALLLLFPFIAVTYGYGAVLESNMLLDSHDPQRFTTLVLSRQVIRQRRDVTYRIELAPWGDYTKPTVDFVADNVYRSLHVGSPACVDLGPGALGIGWYKIAACKP